MTRSRQQPDRGRRAVAGPYVRRRPDDPQDVRRRPDDPQERRIRVALAVVTGLIAGATRAVTDWLLDRFGG
jgi:hypothetical protein